MGQKEVTVYRTTGCPFCMFTAQMLQDRGIAFEEVSLDDHPNRHQATSELLPGHYTVPLIIIDGEPIGGYQELQALDRSGELNRRLDL